MGGATSTCGSPKSNGGEFARHSLDMNTPKDAFLHFSDLGEHLDDYLIMLNGQDALPQDAHKECVSSGRKKDDSPKHQKRGTTAEEKNLLGSPSLSPEQGTGTDCQGTYRIPKAPRFQPYFHRRIEFLGAYSMGDYVAVSKTRPAGTREASAKLRPTVADILPERIRCYCANRSRRR